MTAARPDLKIDGIDWRICKRPAARTLIRGNVLEHDFVPGSYDAIVLISALEHIGLGHYEEDPIDPDGDVRCVERAARWLRRGGLLYFDVPFQPDRYQVLGTECRIYDDATLNTRLWRTLFNQRGRWWTREKNTSTLIPRPTARDPRFYYCACLWEKA